MIDPGTAILISTAVAEAAKAGGQAIGSSQAKKAAKRRSKEMERETYANLFEDTLNRGAELHGQKLTSRSRIGKRKAQSMMDTADLVRGAFNI